MKVDTASPCITTTILLWCGEKKKKEQNGNVSCLKTSKISISPHIQTAEMTEQSVKNRPLCQLVLANVTVVHWLKWNQTGIVNQTNRRLTFYRVKKASPSSHSTIVTYKYYTFQLQSNKNLFFSSVSKPFFFLARFTVTEQCTKKVGDTLQYLHSCIRAVQLVS